MAAKKDKTDVATTSSNYDRMLPQWRLMNTVYSGTVAMREARETHLPRHQYESRDAYEDRLGSAVLFNFTRFTVNTLTGKAFRNPPKISDDSAPAIIEFGEDVDGAGTGLEVFSRRWFRQALLKGVSHVLVDYSSPQPTAEGEVRTRADDDREGVRPYWVLIDPENLIFAHTETVNGREAYTHVRIRENHVVMDGFSESVRERIRVIEPGVWSLYELQAESKSRKQKWVKIEEGTFDLDFVPLVSYYAADKDGNTEGTPPLLDLAHINVRHFQSSSDQDNVLTVARFPMLAVSGGANEDDEGEPLKVGPRQWLHTPDPQGKFYYVEHTGAAIEAGRNDLKDLEEKMASFGAEFLKAKPGTATATSRALDSSEAVSPLQAMGVDFRDALEVALSYTGRWLRLPEPDEVTVVFEVDNDLDALDSTSLQSLEAARNRKDISRRAYLAELKRRGILNDDFDPEDDEEALKTETDTQGGLRSMGSALANNGVVMGNPPPAKE